MNDPSIPRWRRGYAALALVVGFALCVWTAYLVAVVGEQVRALVAAARLRRARARELSGVRLWPSDAALPDLRVSDAGVALESEDGPAFDDWLTAHAEQVASDLQWRQ